MPKFKIQVRRKVEEWATVVVEAADASAAKELLSAVIDEGDYGDKIDWIVDRSEVEMFGTKNVDDSTEATFEGDAEEFDGMGNRLDETGALNV